MKDIIIFLFCFILYSCQSGPSPIVFGEDECYECKMLITDHKFGAEFITDKGKIFKFDSAECLVDFRNKNKDAAYQHLYVINYLNPKELIDAENAGYLISKQLPSPMGGFITSYLSMDQARKQQNTYAGRIYSWSNLCLLRDE